MVVFGPLLVGQLPPPHNPFRCAHHGRFEVIEANVAAEFSDMDEWDRQLVAGQRFLDTLTPKDLRVCPYHRTFWRRPDWKRIAEESVRVAENDSPNTNYMDEASRAKLTKKDQLHLYWLFADPISLENGGGRFVNGQHRGCAIRFSGAKSVAVATGWVDED